MITEQQVCDDVVEVIREIAGDWEDAGDLTPSTMLLADLGLESLGLVVIGTTLQERYGRMPFAEYLAEIGSRPVQSRDVSVAE